MTRLCSPSESTGHLPRRVLEGAVGKCTTVMAGSVFLFSRAILVTDVVPGTRWLTRWDKEIELFVKLLYYGLTTGRGEFDSLFAYQSLADMECAGLQLHRRSGRNTQTYGSIQCLRKGYRHIG